MRRLILCATMVLAGCSVDPPPQSTPSPPPPSVEDGEHTVVFDRAEADKLLGAAGTTLQWIGWDRRGPVEAREENGLIRLRGSQAEAGGSGLLFFDGVVREIGADYFIFDGTIRITDTPEPGRHCEADKLWHFAVTQNRPYWRLREFEWCDGLTDYVDIYFPGTRP